MCGEQRHTRGPALRGAANRLGEASRARCQRVVIPERVGAGEGKGYHRGVRDIACAG
jgi:hypothetical protein